MNRKKEFQVIGIGEILWDIYPEGKKIGGAPANFAYHISELGHRGIIISRVGNDELGKEIIDFLKKNNLSIKYIQIDKLNPTGSVKVIIDKNNQPNYIVEKNKAWDFLGWNKNYYQLLKKTDAIYFGTISQRNDVTRNTIKKFLKAANEKAVIVLDINLRQGFYNKKIIEESLIRATILKLNNFELKIITELLNIDKSFNEEESCIYLMDKYKLGLVCLTMGAEGSKLINPSSLYDCKAYPSRFINSVGAGDAFAAVVTIGYLKGYSLKVISEKANELASWVTSNEESMPAYRHDINFDKDF